MESDEHIPDLKRALKETRPVGPKRPIPPVEPPPPPGDWTTHPVTRTIIWLLGIAAIITCFIEGPGWLDYLRKNDFSFIGTGILVLIFAFLIFFAYWKGRSAGRREDRYWKVD